MNGCAVGSFGIRDYHGPDYGSNSLCESPSWAASVFGPSSVNATRDSLEDIAFANLDFASGFAEG
jgi:hypothetical protein